MVPAPPSKNFNSASSGQTFSSGTSRMGKNPSTLRERRPVPSRDWWRRSEPRRPRRFCRVFGHDLKTPTDRSDPHPREQLGGPRLRGGTHRGAFGVFVGSVRAPEGIHESQVRPPKTWVQKWVNIDRERIGFFMFQTSSVQAAWRVRPIPWRDSQRIPTGSEGNYYIHSIFPCEWPNAYGMSHAITIVR